MKYHIELLSWFFMGVAIGFFIGHFTTIYALTIPVGQ